LLHSHPVWYSDRMRAINVTVLTALFLFTSLTGGIPQDRAGAEISRDLRREWSDLAHGRTEFEVSNPELVPSFLRLAAGKSGCQYENGLRVAPLHFLHIAGRRLALIACSGLVKATQRAFDLSDLQKPLALTFPIVGYPDGIGTSNDAPGFLSWDREAGLFKAEATSDVVSAARGWYTYRFDGVSGFVLLRLEVQRDGIPEWIWEAPRWSDLAKPNK
jgi:hypothetical protein